MLHMYRARRDPIFRQPGGGTDGPRTGTTPEPVPSPPNRTHRRPASRPVTRSGRGLTLLDLIITLAIAAIIATAGVPAFNNVVGNARRTSAVNDLIAAIQVARTNAIRRNQQLVICPDDGQPICTSNGDWRNGWVVFVNTDLDWPPRLDDNDEIVHRHGKVSNIGIDSNRPYYSFRRIGLRSTNGTLTICDNRGPEHARAVIVSYTGRPRVSRQQADGSSLECS